MHSYHIELRSYRIVGWVGFVFFVLCALAALLAGQYWPSVGFVLFSLIGLYVVFGAGSFDINNDTITHHSSFGTWQVRWDEIASVEVGEFDGTLVLHGANKRFILAPPGWWSSSDKSDALTFVQKQLETRSLTPRVSRTAAYKIMKNTRIA
jgi:hypothetical protein